MTLFACRCTIQREEILYFTAENKEAASDYLRRRADVIGRGLIMEVPGSPLKVQR